MKYILRLLFTFILLSAFNCTILHAQGLKSQDLSTVVVDNLSDAQVNQIVAQARDAGLSNIELQSLLTSKGMPAVEVQKLQARINTINNKAAAPASGRRVVGAADSSNNTAATSVRLGPKIFGADLFRGSNTTFEPNIRVATPLNYIIGPDDELNINVYGNSLIDWKLSVSPEGTINIPGVGVVGVSGKTVEQATSIIKSRLAANHYAIGHGTNVNVSLGNIRSIKVIINGNVVKPGTYTLPSLATAFNALYAAGGPDDNGSFRQIEIIRNNRIIRRLDIYDFLTKGDQSNNISLRDQDIIRVPTYRVRVEMRGEVKIPALFETLPGETLRDVIRFAGGFTDTAYTARIQVTQINNNQRQITDVTEDDFSNYTPLRGDIYTVGSIINRFENRVSIVGAVFRPGPYQLERGLTLSQLIAKAAGLREDAFTNRGTISRLNPDNTRQLIAFNVKNIINKTDQDIVLNREDVVTINSIFDLRNPYTVTINGDVRQPKTIPYADSMSVQDLILQAGGLTESSSPRRIEVARRISNGNPLSTNSPIAQVYTVDIDNQLKLNGADFILKPYDIVSVYTLPGYQQQLIVKVEGEVLYPGNYTIQKKDERVSDIIKRAGGLTASGDAKGGTLRRNNAAILGLDKSRIDTAAVERERIDRLQRLQQNFTNNATPITEGQYRNNYVGIDLDQIIKEPKSKSDLILEDGDVIRIPKQQQVVRINGEVLYPSSVIYTSGKSFKGYVINAGGFSPNALRRGAYVVYPNGTVKGTRKFLFFNSHPKVKAGSEIYVPRKPERKGLTTQEAIGITSGLVSIAAIVFAIINSSK